MPNQNSSPAPAAHDAPASPTAFNRDSRDYWNQRTATSLAPPPATMNFG